jgi:RHS repeat-associated protein
MARHLEKVMKKKNRLATMLVNLMKATMTFCLLSLALTILVKGQSNVPATNTRNNKDKTKRSSSPSLAQVNPTTLGLELTLPLSEAAGRAGNSLPIALNYSSKVWRMETGDTATVYQGNFSHQVVLNVVPTFDEHSAAGWTNSLQTPYLENADISVRHDVNGGGSSGCQTANCIPLGSAYGGTFDCGGSAGTNSSGQTVTTTCTCEIVLNSLLIRTCTTVTTNPNIVESYYLSTIFRIIVHLPDGSTRTLVKNMTPVNVSPSQYSQQQNGTYFAIDGSNLRLDYNSNLSSPSVLYLPDGSRYIFSFDANGYQTVQYTDRFGNKLSTVNNATLQRNEWQDTMGRTVAYPPLTKNYSNQNENGVGDFTYTVPGMNGGNLQYTFKWRRLSDADVLDTGETIKSVSQLFIHTTDNSQFNPVVLKEIVTPNGKSYLFKYNSFGEITRIEYPTGAVERFRYEALPPFSFSVGTPEVFYSQGNRGVVERWLNPDGNAANEQHWQYSIPRDNFLRATAPYRVITTAPDGTRSERYLYVGKEISNLDVPKLPSQLAGKAYEERVYAANGTLLRRVLTEWNAQNSTGGGNGGGCISICSESNGEGIVSENSSTINGSPSPYLSSYPRVTRTTNIIFELGSSQALAQSATYQYDGYTNVKREKGYDFTVLDTSTVQSVNISDIPLGNALRTTETDYKTDFAYTSRQMVSLPILTTVKQGDESGAIISKAEMFYDYDQSPYAPYTENSLPTQLASTWEDPGAGVKRGLLTTARTYYDFSNSNGYISTHTQYDQYGNIRKVWDASGDANRFVETFYDDANNQTCGGQVCPQAYAYPTKVRTPAPDPSGTHGTSEASEVTTSYDFNTGLPLSITNLNDLQNPNDDVTTTTEYNDPLLRLTRVNPPAGGSITEYEYSDTIGNLYIKVRSQIDNQNWAETTSYIDGLGRVYKKQTKDAQGDVFAEIEYDNLGRIKQATSPYRQGEQKLWSKPRYDELGRVVESFAPAPNGQTGASLGTVAFGISTVPGFVGTYIVGTDASGRKARSITNSLGQIVRMDEPTTNNDLGTLENPTQPSFYTYSPLGNLVKIQQGQQNRYFMYDSLGRLIRVRQPEQTVNPNLNTTGNPENNQWTSGFTYDVLGNVITVKDAKGVVITNDYDNFGRVKTRSYSDGTTSQVNYYYDGKGLAQSPQFAKGSLTKITNGISETRYTSFDNLGRLLTNQQITDGQTYNFAYKYNLSGGLVEETYPSGRIVKNFFNSDGGLATVASKGANTQFKTIATNFDYSAAGDVKSMMLGNGCWETAQFNSRLQLTQIGLGNSATDTSLWKTEYEYGELNADGTTVDANKNIGNIAKQTTTLPGTNFVQTFKYDALNRLTEAKETTGTTQNWKQTFGYDRFGNRTSFSQIIGTTTLVLNNINHPTIDPNTNRFTSGQGYVYDFNGNLIQDAEGRTFTFNGDDKQVQVKDSNQVVIGTYFYDGEGKRVKKVTNAETTIFVYDGGGDLVAEYSTQLSQTPTTSYLTTDNLGSPRVITDRNGNVISRRDFMPFGEEIFAGVGGRTESMKYSLSGSDNIRKRFTGYEKDDETQLDFAEARMYQNKHGRFTATDPLLTSMSPFEPQAFNRYVYVGNNPISHTDPSGLCDPLAGCGNFTGPVYVTPDHKQFCNDSSPTGGCEGMVGLELYTGKDPLDIYDTASGLWYRITSKGWTELGPEAPAETVESSPTISDHAISIFVTVVENNGGSLLNNAFPRTFRQYNNHTGLGQFVGNTITTVQGGVEIIGGLSGAIGGGAATVATSPLCLTGVGCVVPASTATISATGMLVAAHGVGVIGNTFYNIAYNQGSDTRQGSPALKDDPYSPSEVNKRQSQLREDLGLNKDPDTPIPDQPPGKNLKSTHKADTTPGHATGERNVGTKEEHSRKAKGSYGLPKRK